MEPVVARKTWRTVEPLHGMIYFAPEADERYQALGLDAGPQGYFASRAAALGPVPAEVVIATFFNFNPELVRTHIPSAWDIASPSDLVEARLAGADAALHRGLGEEALASPEMAEAADLVRRAAEAAREHPEGRPLFGGHASLDWPEGPPHLVLWHGETLLREFRGDAHVAALVNAGLSGVEALVMHEASGELPGGFLQVTRAWSDDDWAATIESLASRGLVETIEDGLALTDQGRAERQWVEDRTDAGAVVAYEALGEEGCARLRELARPFSRTATEKLLSGPMSRRR